MFLEPFLFDSVASGFCFRVRSMRNSTITRPTIPCINFPISLNRRLPGEALDALARIDSRKSRMVEMRYFGGLTIKEVAEVLAVSVDTAKRD
jgi:DNA-directed RNA polymerase specialized sigma24 family protein